MITCGGGGGGGGGEGMREGICPDMGPDRIDDDG